MSIIKRSNLMHKYKKILIVTAVFCLMLGTSTIAWVSLMNEKMAVANSDAAISSGWGSEAIRDFRDAAAYISPIASANACGMGASSCFKCHNGARAVAPVMDPKTGPWHMQHKTVNGSCAGCHKGKQRLIKKELAHEGLIKDPRLAVAETCDSCHKSGNSSELNKRYQ